MWLNVRVVIALLPLWSLVSSTNSTFGTPNGGNNTGNISTSSVTYHTTPNKTSAARISPFTEQKPQLNNVPPSTVCTVKPADKEVRKKLSILLELKPKLIQINLTLVNETLVDRSTKYFKPWYWIRTTGRQGQALLMLPFYYSEMSFGMLSIGEVSLDANVIDEPTGCLSSLNDSSKMISTLRELLLNDFKGPGTGTLSEREYLCINRLIGRNGYGHFTPECCRNGPDGSTICRDLERGPWLSVLTGMLTALKIIIFLFSPLMLPGVFYTPRLILDKYKLSLRKPINFNVFVTEDVKKSPPPDVGKLTRENLASWTQFLSVVEDRNLVPRDTIVTMHMNEVNLRMQKRRVISRTYVPVGVIPFLYNNFIRCRIRRNPPLDVCCKANLFGQWAPAFSSSFTWIKLFMILTKIVVLVALPFPYYIRVYMYYMYEEDEMRQRQAALEARNLKGMFEGNFVAFLSPLHVLFIVIYIIFVVEGCSLRLLSNNVRNRFKYVLRVSLREMKNVSYGDKIKQGARILVFPLQKFGCCGFIVGLVYWPVMVPVVIAGAIFYFVPTCYLTVRVLLNFYNIIRELGSRRGLKQQKKSMGNKLSENHMTDFLPGAASRQSDLSGDVTRLRKRYLLKEILTQIFILFCTIATIYATTIILVECCSFFVELGAFTLMGVIVNAKATMKYVTLTFLLAIYLYDSYHSVHVTYRDLANVIIDNAKTRAKNVDEEASKAESMQENTAFVIHAPEDEEGPPPQPSLKVVPNKIPSWEVKRPLLFLDTQDALYVSQKFFEEFCETTTAGCPGPVYVSLMKATLRFLTMVVFLGFVIIIVMVFSDEYSVSTNNQMLATIAGGMLPFLLKKMVFARALSLSISSFSFKYLYDDFVRSYSKRWEIFDLDANLGPAPTETPPSADFNRNKNPPEDAVSENLPVSDVMADEGDTPPANITEDSELISDNYSPRASEDGSDTIIDLFIDLSVNEKQVHVVRRQPGQIV